MHQYGLRAVPPPTRTSHDVLPYLAFLSCGSISGFHSSVRDNRGFSRDGRCNHKRNTDVYDFITGDPSSDGDDDDDDDDDDLGGTADGRSRSTGGVII